MSEDFKLGVTKEFPCNYLPEQQERLLIAVDQRLKNTASYSWLMHQGFRRSGDQIYRPHCAACNQCQSLRVIVDQFSPSKSQRRLLNKAQAFTWNISHQNQDNYYPLYQQYINTLHSDGAMYPATPEQYQGFIECNLCSVLYLELWHQDTLVSVAVTDNLDNALSAVYTFYHPEYRKFGLGMLSIVKQIEQAKLMGKQFLYLGYQIDGCQKMNYKTKFYPHQRLTNNQWKLVNK